jgi:hypothetical protein
MAIQLARSIGMQGGIPESKLPEIVERGLGGIVDTIEKTQEKKEKKSAQEQAMKDAIAASIKVNDIDAHPLDRERYQRKGKEIKQDVIMKSIEGKMTPMEFKKYADEKQMELDNIKYQAEKDYKALIAGSDPAMKKEFHTTDFDRLITGTPSTEVEEDDPEAVAAYQAKKDEIESDRKRVINEETEAAKNYDDQTKNNVIKGLNNIYDEQLAKIEAPKKVKKTIEGQKGYFDIPIEERYNNKTDLGLILEKSKIKKSVGVLPAMQDYQNNFKPESLVKIHRDNKGVVVASPDTEAIEKSRAKYILSMTSPISYGQNHDIEKSALAYSAMQLMEQENIPEKQKPERFREYVEKVAGDSFDRMVETTVNEQVRKTNEARLSKEGSGSGEKSDKIKIEKLEGSVTVPAFEQLRLDKIAEQQAKIDEYTQNIKKYKRKADDYESSGDKASAERERRLAAVAQKTITEIEKTKSLLERHEPNIKDVYIFSSQEEKVDAALNFSGEGETTVKMQPTGIFKMNGVTYIGGISKDGKDIYVPYNQNNKAVLEVNKGRLLEKIQEKGFKTPEELDGEKKKQGGAKPATQKTWAEKQAEKKKNK